MKIFFTIVDYLHTLSAIIAHLALLNDGHFDATNFGELSKSLNNFGATLAAYKTDCNSTKQDEFIAEYAKKCELIAMMEEKLLDVLDLARKCLIGNILGINNANDTFYFVVSKYAKLHDLSIDSTLGLGFKTMARKVINHLSRETCLDVSERAFPCRGIMTALKKDLKASRVMIEFNIDISAHISGDNRGSTSFTDIQVEDVTDVSTVDPTVQHFLSSRNAGETSSQADK